MLKFSLKFEKIVLEESFILSIQEHRQCFNFSFKVIEYKEQRNELLIALPT